MKNFDDIIGNDKVIEHLQNAIKLNKVSHAYILNGDKGCGKKTIASIFAKTLQCSEGGKTACGNCTSCRQSDSGNQPDIKWVTHEKPGVVGVEDVRQQLVGDMQIKPYSSRYKIYIIDEAEKMNIQAQNAILKTIEEPPAYGIIILLTTNADLFLPTILSRCIRLDVKPVNTGLVEKYLEQNCKVSTYKAHFAANFAQGNIGKAEKIATSPDFEQLKDTMLHLVKYIDDMTFSEMMAGVKAVNEYKLSIEDFLDMMALWFRDVLIFKSTSDTNLIIFRDEINDIARLASLGSYEGLEQILEALDKAKDRLRANVNFDLTIELLLLTICDYYKNKS
ncbi:MAG: ATP-binding protein [Lachnospiraceae bacterium]